MENDTELAASGAELAILQAFSAQDGMESCFEKQRPKEITVVIPDAKLKESTTSMENKNVPVTRLETTENVTDAVDKSTLQILQRQNEISELLLQ